MYYHLCEHILPEYLNRSKQSQNHLMGENLDDGTEIQN